MKLTHKTFSKQVVGGKRITSGGNEVYDAVDEKDKTDKTPAVARVLLTDSCYWEREQ